MKILTIGDPHIKSDNVREFIIFEERLHKLMDTINPNFVVVLGDVLHHHEKLYTPSLNQAIDFIKKIGDKYKTFVLVGNHDMINNQQFLSENHWMNSIKLWNKNITVVDKVVHYNEDIYNFLFCPYVYPGRFIEAIHTQPYDYKQSNIIFAHQEFRGCKMGAIISEEGDEWNDDNPMVISGHIHSNQWIGKKIYYPGSAMQHAFGESEKNIISVIDIDSICNINITEHDLGLARKKIITLDIDNIDKLDKKLSSRNGDQIKISLVGGKEEFKIFKKTLKYKKLIDEGFNIVFKQKNIKIETLKPSEDFDFDSILNNLILEEKNNDLFGLYQKLIMKK